MDTDASSSIRQEWRNRECPDRHDVLSCRSSVTVRNNPGITKAGYTFVGWNKKTDGTGNNYNGNDTLIISSSDITLYAKWTALPTYTVIYNGMVIQAALFHRTGIVILPYNRYCSRQYKRPCKSRIYLCRLDKRRNILCRRFNVCNWVGKCDFICAVDIDLFRHL